MRPVFPTRARSLTVTEMIVEPTGIEPKLYPDTSIVATALDVELVHVAYVAGLVPTAPSTALV